MNTKPLPKISLAPLAGITDWPFRLLCSELGADEAVTEMISAQGYLTAPKDSYAYRDIMLIHANEAPVIAQVFGHKPDYIYEAIRRISDSGDYCGIDINMGCPAPKVTGSGSGSALMKKPELAREIMKTARYATLLPLSVKMRLGWDEDSINVLQFAQMAQDEGVDSITVHGRTRVQQYAGKADWEWIARVKQAVKIPVYGNGDVFSAADARAMLEQTSCDGLAIGRGSLGNPWLFAQIKQNLLGQVQTRPIPQEVLALALRHARMMVDWKGEVRAVVEMRKHFAWYLKGLRGAAPVRSLINTLTTLESVEETLTVFLNSNPAFH